MRVFFAKCCRNLVLEKSRLENSVYFGSQALSQKKVQEPKKKEKRGERESKEKRGEEKKKANRG